MSMTGEATPRPERSFIEESASVFRVPGYFFLGALSLFVLAGGTWLVAELLDRVLRAFSAAAALKAQSALAGNFRNLVATGLWFLALALAFRNLPRWLGGPQAGPKGGLARLGLVLLAALLAGLFVAAPGVYDAIPLLVPVALLVAIGVGHLCLATHTVAIAIRELKGLLLNPLGYVVLTVFAVVLAILFTGAIERLEQANPTSELNIAPLRALLGTADLTGRELNFLVIALLLIVPVITMRLIAEEKRSGTEEVLLTTPVQEWHVAIGKFAGTFLFYLLLWGLALVPIYYLSLMGNLDWGQVLSAYLGLAVIGFGLLGIGVFASAVTRNQLAAAVLTFLGMLAFTFQSFTELPSPRGDFAWLRTAALYLDLRQHLAWVARGTVDSRTVFLFLSTGVFMLFLTVRALETRRWAGFTLRQVLAGRKALAAGAGLAVVVLAIAGLIYGSGLLQLRELEAARAARLAQLRAEAEAAREAAAAKGKAAGVLEEVAGLGGKGPTVKPAAEEKAEAPKKKAEEKGTKEKAGKEGAAEKKASGAAEPAPAKKPGGKDGNGGQNRKEPPQKEEKATGATQKSGPEAEGKQGEAKGKQAKEEEKGHAAAQPPLKPRWTPKRIAWVVFPSLILLMLYLAVFSRALTGSFTNQVVFGANVIVSSLAALTLAVLANYLATRNHKALDLTRGKIFSLHPAVQRAIDQVLPEGETVQAIALVGRFPNTDDREEVDDNYRRDVLEREFQKFAEALNRPGVLRFAYSFVNPKREPDKKNQLVSEYNITGNHEVILLYRDRYAVLEDRQLFDLVVDDQRFREFLRSWQEMLRRGGWAPPLPPTREEQIQVAELWLKEMGSPNYLRTVRPRKDIELTIGEAIVQLVQSPGFYLYYTVGHGEKRLDVRRKAADLERRFGEASLFRQTLARENFRLYPLPPLVGERQIPERCNYLLIADPTRPFAPEERRKIEAFVRRGGHLIVFAEAAHNHGLNPLLRKFGVEIEKSQIWMASMGGFMGMRRGGFVPRTPILLIYNFNAKDHPIAKELAEKSSETAKELLRPYPGLVMVLASPIKRVTAPEEPAPEKEEQGQEKKEKASAAKAEKKEGGPGKGGQKKKAAGSKEKKKAAPVRWKVTTLLQAHMLTGRSPQDMSMPYAERDLDKFNVTKDPEERMGPFDVAVLCEPEDPASGAGKILLVSDGDFIEDKLKLPEGFPPLRADVSTYGVWDNELFLKLALRHLKKRPKVIRAEPRPVQPYALTRFQASAYPDVLGVARLMLWGVLPAFFVVLGFVVYLVRRKA